MRIMELLDMKPSAYFLLLLLETNINGLTPMVHRLRYFDTYSSQVPNFPEYVQAGYLNDLQISHYDSDTRRHIPKQEWMNRITEEDPRYWDRQTQINHENEQAGKANIEIVKQRLNVTGGSHMYQVMYGCEWDDETNETRGYDQRGFDGDDFIVFDFETGTFVAAKQEAFATKLKWEKRREAEEKKRFLTNICAEYLKKHVRNGEQALKRTVLPVVSLLQRTSRAPVTCHATGFYPERAKMFWAKDGEEVLEGVDIWEILPNGDGTFQISVSLDLSSVLPEDWGRYSCVFQLSGVKDDVITRVERDQIRANEKRKGTVVIVVVVTLVMVAVLTFGVALFLNKKKQAKKPPAYVTEPMMKEKLNGHEQSNH